ncbi:LGFP repeat family protein [Mycobacterium xenopi 3993]|nr:LGFP repeat family protein [Mycobacterium xenopi 3993]
MRRGGLVGRAVLTLAAAVVPVAVAPVAVASPESDADAAITAAWEAGGGADSRLGPSRARSMPSATASSKTSPAAKSSSRPRPGQIVVWADSGPIRITGRTAGSDLGFPTISEVPGLAGPDTLVSTFSASDKPVIFWSAAHGAFVVRGAMNAAWDKLGSSGGRWAFRSATKPTTAKTRPSRSAADACHGTG